MLSSFARRSAGVHGPAAFLDEVEGFYRCVLSQLTPHRLEFVSCCRLVRACFLQGVLGVVLCVIVGGVMLYFSFEKLSRARVHGSKNTQLPSNDVLAELR